MILGRSNWLYGCAQLDIFRCNNERSQAWEIETQLTCWLHKILAAAAHLAAAVVHITCITCFVPSIDI